MTDRPTIFITGATDGLGRALAHRLAEHGAALILHGLGRHVDELETGVAATARLAIAPELAGVTGRFYDRIRETKAHAQAYDPEARRRLWQRSLDLVGHPDPLWRRHPPGRARAVRPCGPPVPSGAVPAR